MDRIVFIDRDGVINVDPIGDYVKRWEDFKFEKDALKTLKAINDLGLEIILISNQAGVGDGVYPESSLREIHKNMLAECAKHGITIRDAHFCLHGKKAGCHCRKPKPGLFEQAIKKVSIDPKKTFFIGDKATDVEAGLSFGIRTIFVRTGHGKYDEAKLNDKIRPDFIADAFYDTVAILKQYAL